MQLISLRLTDFQAHKRLAIDFAPGITTIIGPTDRGKTAVLRALGWVGQNNMAGEEFIREGAKETRVELIVTDGKKLRTIVRTKGKVNSYSLDGKEFLAFGQGVPRDVTQLLQLNEINFQLQHDAPFWFSETAGEVSRKLNAVIDLTIIDSALSNIGAAVRQCTERKATTEERLQEAKTELGRLDSQKARVKEFDELKQKEQDASNAFDNCNRLEELLERIRSNQAAELRERSLALQAVLSNAQEVVRISRQEILLQDVIKDIEECQAAAQPPPDFNVVEQAYKGWTQARDRRNGLVGLVDRIIEWQGISGRRAEILLKKAEEFGRKTKGEKCPLCGNQIQ